MGERLAALPQDASGRRPSTDHQSSRIRIGRISCFPLVLPWRHAPVLARASNRLEGVSHGSSGNAVISKNGAHAWCGDGCASGGQGITNRDRHYSHINCRRPFPIAGAHAAHGPTGGNGATPASVALSRYRLQGRPRTWSSICGEAEDADAVVEQIRDGGARALAVRAAFATKRRYRRVRGPLWRIGTIASSDTADGRMRRTRK